MVLTLCVVNVVSGQLNNIEGDWEITEAMVSGQEVPSSILSSMKLKINRGNFDAKSGSSMSKGKISNAGGSSPKQILFTINDGADNGREIKAIYELQNQNLKIAYSQSDDFPTEFTSTKANRFLVMTYKNTAPKTASRSRRRSGRSTEFKRGNTTLTPLTSGTGGN